MGGTSLVNLPFTLHIMNATTGFTYDQKGVDHYINVCKRNGLLPIGCGTNSHNCDKNRFNDEPCMPMPESWSCNIDMMTKIRSTTGWGSNIVAISNDNTSFLKKGKGDPNGNEYLQAVCGRVSGISLVKYDNERCN